jgi:DNA-binding MarR family transcriptional regulator
MGELARRARLSKQTMTTLVRLVEREGFVRRERDPEDGRAFRIRLSERGLAFRPVAARVVSDLDALVAARLSPIEVAGLTRALKGVMEL